MSRTYRRTPVDPPAPRQRAPRPRKRQAEGRCPPCDKWTLDMVPAHVQAQVFGSLSGEPMNAYLCPHGNGWHVGHVVSRRVRADLARAVARDMAARGVA